MASTTTARPPARGRRRRPEAEEDEARESVVEPYRLTPKLARRVGLLGAVILVGFAALLLRLWALQVLSGPHYVAQAQANQFRIVRVQAPRGPILDSNGRVLVSNAAATAVELWPANLPKVYKTRYLELRELARVTRVPLYEIAAKIKQRREANDMLTPIVVLDQAPKAMVTYLYERASDFPGVVMERTYVRHYPYHSLAAQLLGYVGEVSSDQLRTLQKQGYAPGDEIGQAGLEARYDSYLRGVAGDARVRVDSLGRPRSTRELVTPTQPGHALRLTLNLGLQKAAESALRYGIQLARNDGQWAANGGAVVAIDPKDGSIRALASEPGYEPSVYTGHVAQKRLDAQGLSGKTALAKNYPSLDRALDGTYPPGSTFKPLTAIAAMQEHILSPYAYQPCTGKYTAPEDKSHHVFHNWDPNVNQAMDLPTALAYSCDTYFYGLGNDFFLLPADRGQPLQKWARAFGFGAPTGVDVGPEANGLVPTISWREHTFTSTTDPCCWQVDRLWKPGDSIQLAIGQGDLLVTPLQMARFYAALANGGKLVTPHLLEDVENSNKTIVPTPPVPSPQPIPGLDPQALRIVQQGLYEGTHATFGTSYGVFGQFPVPIAGKTGTAEKVVSLPGYTGKQNQSWWCGYGPVTPTPKLVVCAVIENGGHGGTAAAPAAARVFAKFFNVHLKQTGPIHSD
ncbi:MAG TPA: penicillin-binding protein 2 [Gaiellaceae bacterium]|nr:penicillin-binding protein 2 [Gaiellaceae bacterium]